MISICKWYVAFCVLRMAEIVFFFSGPLRKLPGTVGQYTALVKLRFSYLSGQQDP